MYFLLRRQSVHFIFTSTPDLMASANHAMEPLHNPPKYQHNDDEEEAPPAYPEMPKYRVMLPRQSVRFAHDITVIPVSEESNQDLYLTVRDLANPDGEEGLYLRRDFQVCLTNWRTSHQNIALLLLLCTIPVIFIIGVVAWACHNPRDICEKAPQLVTLFNSLSPAAITVSPGLLIGMVLTWVPAYGDRNVYSDDVQWLFNRMQISLTMVLIALVTVVFMPWIWEREGWGYGVDCGV